MQKITVEVPKHLLASAQEYWGDVGITEAVRKALEEASRKQSQRKLLELRGLFKPSITAEELRSWEDDE